MSFSQLLQRVVVAVAGTWMLSKLTRFCYTDLIWVDRGCYVIK